MMPRPEPADASVGLVSFVSVLLLVAHAVYCARDMSRAALGDAVRLRRPV